MPSEITLRDVCAKAGCSPALASVVLNQRKGNIRASEETRAKILAVASELGYVPNRTARCLRMSRSYLLAVIAWNLSSSFVPEILSGIEEQCLNTNYGVLLGAYRTESELFARWEGFRHRGVEGVICIGNALIFPRAIREESQMKCVFIGGGGIEEDKPLEYGRVSVDRSFMNYLAAQAIVERGHRQIGYITNYPPEECTAWRSALNALSVPVGPICQCENNLESGITVATSLLKAHPELTAIFTDSDLLGIAVLNAAQICGRHVPEDLSVLGVDDSLLCKACTPNLASLSQPRREQGVQAAAMLIRMLEGGKPEDIVMKGDIVIRGSLGTVR